MVKPGHLDDCSKKIKGVKSGHPGDHKTQRNLNWVAIRKINVG